MYVPTPDAEQGARLLKGRSARWRRFASSPDGSRLTVAGSQAVGIWDIDSLELVTTLHADTDLRPGILALSFASRDRLLTFAAPPTFGRRAPIPVLTWDLSTGQPIARTTLEVPPVRDIQRALVTHNHQVFLAAGWSATIAWRLDHPSPVAMVPRGVTGQALAVSRDGTLAVTCGGPPEDAMMAVTVKLEELRLWSLPELRQLQSWKLTDSAWSAASRGGSAATGLTGFARTDPDALRTSTARDRGSRRGR
jgi:hypothetical protein